MDVIKGKLSSAILLVILACCAIIFQSHFATQRFSNRVVIPECPWCDVSETTNEEVPFLPVRVEILRLAAPADPDFLADLFWLRVCYYFGAHSLTTRKYPYLFEMIDMITELAPRWEGPFLFGALILPTEAGMLEDGLYLIDKGLVFHPDNWELFFFKGYYHWKMLDDPIGASEMLFKASQIKDAPKYLARLSASLASKAGRRELAIRFLQEAMENLDDHKQREALLRKMEEIRDGV